ncbi:8227_t:CDS:2 [Racocetra fulgida]|nr:8227_t:CDS:2 [Racocetra fulgida]
MSFPHLWTPSLEPRTVVHSWYRHAMVNEAVALDKEEEELILLTQPLTEEQPSDFLSPERDPTRDIESSELAVFQAMGAEDYSRGFLNGLD